MSTNTHALRRPSRRQTHGGRGDGRTQQEQAAPSQRCGGEEGSRRGERDVGSGGSVRQEGVSD
jgi:hypothetical protein